MTENCLPRFEFHPEEKERFVGFSVRTRGGAYYIRWRDSVDQRSRECRGGRTHTEVIQTLEKLAPAARMGSRGASPAAYFCDVVEDWFEREVIPNRKPSTLKNYVYFTERFLLPTFDTRRFSRITKPMVDDFISRLADYDTADVERKSSRGVSHETTQQVKKVMKSLWRWAQREGYVDENVAAHLQLEAAKEILPERVTYTAEQFELLLRYVNPYYRTHLQTLFYSSMRWGELAGLPWKNVTFRDDGTVDVHIRQALSAGVIATPKTSRSCRTITMPAFVGDALSKHREVQRTTQPANPDDFVFTSLEGVKLDSKRFRERIYYHAIERANKALKKQELPELPKVTLHGLRHSTISLLARQSSLTSAVVQQHAGHTSAATTAIYTHADETSRKMVCDVMEAEHAAAVSAMKAGSSVG